MKSPVVVIGLLTLAACAPNEAPPAKLWSVRDMHEAKNLEADFGGWTPRRLVVPVGFPLFFEENAVTVNNTGMVVQPGVADGASAPFVITEVWKDHPVPWVQPVWVPRRRDGAVMPQLINVFPVSDDSTFYSPFWQLEVVVSDDFQPDNVGFRSAREALAMMSAPANERIPGPLVYCPVVPADILFAAGAGGLRDPITGAPLQRMDALNEAWSEGERIFYAGIGVDRFPVSEQLPVASRAYFFVKSPGAAVLPVAAVLPSSPRAHSFLTRVDAVLPAKAGVYVPTSRPNLRGRLLGEGVPAPVPSLVNGTLEARALQVAADASCFTTGAIAQCVWLDSEAALLAAGVTLSEQPVQLAAAVLERAP
jgi:hypothetical protein